MIFLDPFFLCIVSILVLAVLGLPIGLSMIAGSILYLFMSGLDMGIAAEQFLNRMYSNYIILAVPLFILAAEFMNTGSLSDRLLAWCNAVVGRFRGGLAQVNVLQSMVFAGMSGSAIADAAGTGKMIYSLMTRDGKYPASFAAALTASSAVIGPIIPPSIPMVLYALVSDASIGYLFLGGIVPGAIMGISLAIIVYFKARTNNFPVEDPVPLRELPRITWTSLPALMMPVVLLFCIYSGITTPTEAAAVAAAYALIISIVLYRSISLRSFYRSLVTSSKTTVSIGMLIAGALVLNYVVTVENIPATLSSILTAWNLDPITFLIFVNVVLLLLGCMLEGTAIILIIVPVLVPSAAALGIDLVHFGVVVVINVMIGLITPPYGMLLFVMQSISRAKLRHIVGDTLPFLGVLLAALLLFTFVPDTVLWLPRMFGYQG
ncbi:TRAP transporter large permease [Pelagibacterium nitratireducens]|jgi:C4-dicarboxylate transporter, DctM subunit|uniref:TRAP transporter large permease protein n=1 Tax=Pelagibacterium nitratireducens TaxID=1046114 RepID=A0ABZ2I2A9_9HYPH|tara:strand:- start:26502 stop:27803 length:1302 start_codon:yes stop_codon:yes gene_type:complete